MKCLLKSARLIRYFDREFFYISNKTNCKWKQFWLGQHKYYEKVKQITTFCIEIMTPTQITRTHLWNQDMIETSMWFWSVSLANQSSGQFLIFLGSAKKLSILRDRTFFVHSLYFFVLYSERQKNQESGQEKFVPSQWQVNLILDDQKKVNLTEQLVG